MASKADDQGSRRWSPWRIAAWSFAGTILLLPLVAMQFTDEVAWSAFDFVFAAALVGGAGLAFELAARRSRSLAYRLGAGLALAAGFLLVWINGAVGIIGTERDPANLMFIGVIALALAGALVARFRPVGMARAMIAAAIAEAAVGAIALVPGVSSTGPAWQPEIPVLTAFFTALWLASAWLFGKAAREQGRQAVPPATPQQEGRRIACAALLPAPQRKEEGRQGRSARPQIRSPPLP